MPITLEDAAKAAFVAYYGPSVPRYGPNDSSTVWAMLEPEEKTIWLSVAKAVVDAAQAGEAEDQNIGGS
jgi:hypothetical protein